MYRTGSMCAIIRLKMGGTMNLFFRKADIGELDTALSLLKHAAEWLNNQNIDYWQNWNNPEEIYVNWIAEGFQNNQFFFVEDKDFLVESRAMLVGMYRLQYEDELFWGKRNDRAVYIHSFTTERTLKGNNIGQAILKYIENKAKDEGISYIRLDCSSSVEGLCKYYERMGFKAVGEIEIFGEVLTLFQKEVE